MGNTTPQGAPRPLPRARSVADTFKPVVAALALTSVLALRAASPAAATSAALTSGMTILSVLPSPATLRVGQRITLDVWVFDAPPLAGVSLELQFDPSILQVVEIGPGVLIQMGPMLAGTFVVQPDWMQVDNQAGAISFTAHHDAGSDSYPSGNGCLIRFAVQAVGEGDTGIHIQGSGTELVLPDGVLLPHGTADGTIAVLPSVVCSNPLSNGGFEDPSPAPWVLEGMAWICQRPHAGASSAWLGGYNSADDLLWRDVTLSARTTSAALKCWWLVETQETGASVDWMVVELYDQSGAWLAELHRLSNADGDGAWHESPPLELSGYKGQTVHLRFHATGNGTGVTSFYVDDVTLDVCETPLGQTGVFLPLIVNEPAGG